MKENFYISVIIPVYNAEKFVETAVRSVLIQQSCYVEIIIINDGSTDNSLEICEKLSKENGSIKCISVPNGGAGHARNIGINVAKGDWIIFLDSDDMILGDFFTEDLKKYLIELEIRKIDIVYTPKIVCDYAMVEKPRIVYPEDIKDIHHNMPSIEFWSSIYRKDFLNRCNIRFFEYSQQDIESAFRFRAFSRTRNIMIDRLLLFYVHRDNPESNVNTWNKNILMATKARVYYDLYQEFLGDEHCTKTWLYYQFLYWKKELIINGLKFGYSEIECNMADKLLTLSDANIHNNLGIKYRILEEICFIMNKISVIKKVYLKKCTKKKNKTNDITTIKKIEKDNINEIMLRLELYKKIIYEEKKI